MNKTMTSLLLLLCCALSVQAQEAADADDQAVPEAAVISESDARAAFENQVRQETNTVVLLQLAEQARVNGDLAIMTVAAERLHELRPSVATHTLLLARAHAMQDHKQQTYDLMLRMMRQGLSFDLEGDTDFDPVRGTEAFTYMQAELIRNGAPNGDASLTTTLSRDDLLADGLAWDPKREAFLVGSVTEGAVFILAEDGQLTTLLRADEANGLQGVFDIGIDADRRHLWVASGSVPHFRHARFEDAGRTGVWKFDLDSGAMLDRLEAPKGSGILFTNLTVAPDGTVFVADGSSPMVYRIDPGQRQINRFFAAPSFTSLRALAVDSQGRHLYFADYELGLFAVDLAEQRTRAITGDATMYLGGVDDLMWHKGALILIQNGTQPHRVVRLQLSEDGGKAVRMVPIVSAHPTFQAPATGTVVGDQVHLLSASHWNHYDPATGKPLEGAELSRPAIVTASLEP